MPQPTESAAPPTTVQPLHVHRYGPAGPAQVLGLHGLTGHGQRWELVATQYLPDVTVLAPDLIGHGRSSWAAPWSVDANVAALAELLDAPVVVAAHSFGATVALQLATAHPDLVSALVLLDPAVGLDGDWMRQIAEAMLASPDYTDAAEARAEKSHGSWRDVDDDQLDIEVAEHLISLPNGRVGWRISIPAMTAYWSELARPIAVPPNDIAITIVRAQHTSPPYVSSDLIEKLSTARDFRLIDTACNHMVPQALPAQTAQLIQERLPCPR